MCSNSIFWRNYGEIFWKSVLNQKQETRKKHYSAFPHKALCENLLDPSHVPFAHHGMMRGARRGTNGVSTNWVAANFVFFDRGTFGVLPSTYFYLPGSARVYLFPQSVKSHYLCSCPISVDTTGPQPQERTGSRPGRCRWRSSNPRSVDLWLWIVRSLLILSCCLLVLQQMHKTIDNKNYRKQ